MGNDLDMVSARPDEDDTGWSNFAGTGFWIFVSGWISVDPFEGQHRGVQDLGGHHKHCYNLDQDEPSEWDTEGENDLNLKAGQA